MTTLQTIGEPKAERLCGKPVPENIVENDKLYPQAYQYLDRDERDILKGQTVYPPLTLQEIVAICKEVRAERYEEEQKQKNTSGF